jgi:SAM-dependent methyltransferase
MKLPDSAPRAYTIGPYLKYQERYAQEPKESDKIFLALVRELAAQAAPAKSLRLLDIGCSTGNLLRHLKRAMPGICLAGGELFPEIVEHCRNDPELKDVAFDVMDVRDLPTHARYDVVVASALLFRFSPQQFKACCAGIARLLDAGGSLLALDWYHPFYQDLTTLEQSHDYPEGLTLHFRSYETTERLLKDAGFAEIRFRPFDLPIDLPRPPDPADLSTYTRREEGGARIQFRGAIYQPWCHMIAHKA